MYSRAGVEVCLGRGPPGPKFDIREGYDGCWKPFSVMDGEGDSRGGVIVRSRDLEGGNKIGGV
jgi:hypothetical protein